MQRSSSEAILFPRAARQEEKLTVCCWLSLPTVAVPGRLLSSPASVHKVCYSSTVQVARDALIVARVVQALEFSRLWTSEKIKIQWNRATKYPGHDYLYGVFFSKFVLRSTFLYALRPSWKWVQWTIQFTLTRPNSEDPHILTGDLTVTGALQ